ncbi:MAG: ATP-binding cassette domain-containing protein [bacterium]|nr:ATP-binding cassette domain-containing protein [bacterium]
MIEVENLTKNYGAVQALRGVSFTVPSGQVVGLLGPNGAGKSTAMRIITGYIGQTSGSARVDGQEVVEDPIECQRKIGYLPEGNPLYLDMRLNESLRFSAEMHGLRGPDRETAIKRSMEQAGLQGLGRRTIGTFSKGFRQRVGLAQALLHEPQILILDEPTSGLDPNQQEEMRALIRRLGEDCTIILSTHILPEVEASCSRALIINAGKLVAEGSVEELKAQARGTGAVQVTVRADDAQITAAFDGLPFVNALSHDVDPVDRALRRVRLELAEAPEASMLEAVSRAAADHQLPLSALSAEVVSLERIFAELTRTEAGAVSSPVEAAPAQAEGGSDA